MALLTVLLPVGRRAVDDAGAGAGAEARAGAGAGAADGTPGPVPEAQAAARRRLGTVGRGRSLGEVGVVIIVVVLATGVTSEHSRATAADWLKALGPRARLVAISERSGHLDDGNEGRFD